ncbi:MAG: protein kinase [Planctomycetes bacterium]|nr:protein kinase [Planctomycetota bacterium]
MTRGSLSDYEVLEELGRGGAGVVYRARHQGTGECVAIKLLSPDTTSQSTQRERFLREAHALERLRHPAIVRLREVGRHEGQLFLVLDYHGGGTLAERCEREPLSVLEVEELGVALSRALEFVHAEGSLHRDLKPANVLYSSNGRPLLTDFGLVKARSSGEVSLTQTGIFLGTPGYLSPEQASGLDSSVATDVYGLGATLYAALTTRPPIQGLTLIDSLQKTLEDPPPRLRSLRSDVPRALAELIERCLEKDPKLRPQSATEVREALEASAGVQAPTRSPVALAALVGLGLIGGVAVLWLGASTSPPPSATTPSAESLPSTRAPQAASVPSKTPSSPRDAPAERARRAWGEGRALEARSILLSASEGGDLDALALLGTLLIQGPEEVRDLSQGAGCWRRAAEGGQLDAAVNHGLWLVQGPEEVRQRAEGIR